MVERIRMSKENTHLERGIRSFYWLSRDHEWSAKWPTRNVFQSLPSLIVPSSNELFIWRTSRLLAVLEICRNSATLHSHSDPERQCARVEYTTNVGFLVTTAYRPLIRVWFTSSTKTNNRSSQRNATRRAAYRSTLVSHALSATCALVDMVPQAMTVSRCYHPSSHAEP